jgi:hypothetical protein
VSYFYYAWIYEARVIRDARAALVENRKVKLKKPIFYVTEEKLYVSGFPHTHVAGIERTGVGSEPH